jgi:hypothetical protein
MILVDYNGSNYKGITLLDTSYACIACFNLPRSMNILTRVRGSVTNNNGFWIR